MVRVRHQQQRLTWDQDLIPGMALNLYLQVEAELMGSGIEIVFSGVRIDW